METYPIHRSAKSALPRYLELDGIRGLAVLAVFFHHLCFVSRKEPPSFVLSIFGFAEWLIYRISAYGATGVDLFFVLSGFLITSILLHDRDNPAFYRDFYWKRALRILPLYFFCLLGILVFLPGSGSYVLLSALFIPNFASVLHISASGPFWSLGIEEQFYLVWPTVIRRRSLQEVQRWAVGIWLMVVLLRLAAAPAGHFDYYLTLLRLDGLAGGALLACRQRRQGMERTTGAFTRSLTAFMATGLLLVIAGAWTMAPRWAPFRAVCRQTGVGLMCIGSIGFAIAYAGTKKLAVLRSAPLVFFGAISYALYLTHAYVAQMYDHIAGPLPAHQPKAFALRWISVLAATVVVCLVSRYFLELPALSLRKYVLHRPAPLPETAEPLVRMEDSSATL